MVTRSAPAILSPSVKATVAKLAAVADFQRTERFVIGRAHEFHIVTLCLVARKHPLLFGSPGTAKTMTVDALMEHIPLTSFRTQAYKASPPEQFIGPISFKGMENDVFCRIVTGKLPDVEVGIVDEITRAPRAVLPAFQGMMVEREFDTGDGVVPIPLRTLIGTCNTIQDDPELQAFFDRWTFKLIVKAPQTQNEMFDILKGALHRQEHGPAPVPPELMIGRAELLALQKAADRVVCSDDIVWKVAELYANVTGIGVVASPRRYVQLIEAMRSNAILDGRDEVLIDDLQLASDSFWNFEDEAPKVRAEVVKFASPWVRSAAGYLNAFTDLVSRLGEIQGHVARGADGTAKVTLETEGPDATEQSMNEHSIKYMNESLNLRETIKNHIADAQGRDTADLENALTQMQAGREWISNRLLGGLMLR